MDKDSSSNPAPPAPVRGVLGLIGSTRMVELAQLDTGPCALFAKLEMDNPGGSIKDRIARRMIEQAEREGRLEPGGTLVEATAGNTGIGLALLAALRGYRLVVVVPDKMSLEKVDHLRALGAKVVVTRSDVEKGHPAYYQEVAARIASEQGAFYVNQFENDANAAAHYETTGPEIWAQLDGRVDAAVFSVGTGGTLTGTSRYLREKNPDLEVVLADPAGSVLAPLVETGEMVTPGSWLTEGIGEDFVPPVLDLDLVSRTYVVDDREAFLTARRLLREEGLFAGSSTGVILAGALRYCREQRRPKRVVAVIPDSGAKYLSKMYSDQWMSDHGFLARERRGDLRDLIARRHVVGDDYVLAPSDTLAVAHNRMKLYGISQLPVVDDGRVVGLVDETDLLRAASGGASAFGEPVSAAMTQSLRTLAPASSLDELRALLDSGMTALIAEGERYFGLVTRIDLIDHLRRESES